MTPAFETAVRINTPPRRTDMPLCVPVRFGVPVPRNSVYDGCRALLIDRDNRVHELHATATGHWFDGSTRWLRLEGTATLYSAGASSDELRLVVVNRFDSLETADRDAKNDQYEIIQVVPREATISLQHREQLVDITPRLSIKRECREVLHINSCTCLINTSEVQKLKAIGRFGPKSRLLCLLTATLYRKASLLRLEITLRNPRRARHKGGLWDLGDPGSVLIKEFAVDINLPEMLTALTWSETRGGQADSITFHNQLRDQLSVNRSEKKTNAQDETNCLWSLFQASSGGQNWKSVNHTNARGVVTLPFRGYRLRYGNCEESNDRITPTVILHMSRGCVGLTVPYFWEEFPKKIDIFNRSITLGLLAPLPGDCHELQGGEQKTFETWFSFTAQEPLIAMEHLEAAAETSIVIKGDFPPLPEILIPVTRETYHRSPEDYCAFIRAAIFGDSGIIAKREIVDEYGWRHFGDVYADHEEKYYVGTTPLISHYNNQFDLLCGAILHRCLSEDIRWDKVIGPLARHVADIDIYHTDEDRASFNHGLFWMTDHYRSAHLATHRAFSRMNKTEPNYGGGPCNEHNYTTGLLLYYYLWGYEPAREAVLELAEWVLNMEDGCLTPFFIIDDGPTGLASCTSSVEYHGPGRGAANSINALLDGWLLSEDARFLQMAEEIIRRTISPGDDIDSLNLLDAENRWSYTMYLEILAKYIRIKYLWQMRDEMFSFAVESLLHYARWMLINERPYLERPETLQYPTEAWAAQEFRKATILYLAAALVDETEAAELRAKAKWFEEKAWEELLAFENPINARTTAVLLSQGLWHLGMAAGSWDVPGKLRQEKLQAWPKREAFVPQRRRVREKVKSPATWLRIARRLVNPSVVGHFLQLLWRWRN